MNNLSKKFIKSISCLLIHLYLNCLYLNDMLIFIIKSYVQCIVEQNSVYVK